MPVNKADLIKRITTGTVFVLLMIGGIVAHEVSFVVLFSIISLLTLLEFYNLADAHAGANIDKKINIVMGLYLFIVSYLYASGKTSFEVYVPYIVYLMYMFIVELYRKQSNPILNWAFTLLGHAYIVVPFCLINYLAFRSSSEISYHFIPVLAVFLCVWSNDSFAFLFGSMFGKHRLFERISPKKSWEGFVGGLLGSIVIAVGISVVTDFFDFSSDTLSLVQWIIFGVICSVFATFGDLCESLLKRNMQIKDSGNILPGHGGMLDRFDATLMVIPAIVVYFSFLRLFDL